MVSAQQQRFHFPDPTMRAEALEGQKDLDVDEPRLDGFEALGHSDVVHQHHAVCLAEELLGYAAEPEDMNINA